MKRTGFSAILIFAGAVAVFGGSAIFAQDRAKDKYTLEVPGGLAVPVHLRERVGALVFTAARLSGHSARELHRGNAEARVFDAQGMRADVHGELRAAGGNSGQLAGAPDVRAATSGGSARDRIGTNREVRKVRKCRRQRKSRK